MGFSFGSFAAGFAERDMEKRDRERKDAMDLAKSTLNYRAELAMENKRKRETRISSDVRLGRNLMNNFGFSKAQVGALISQGELENVYDAMKTYQMDAKNKGKPMPSANTIVKLASDKPVDMDFEEYVSSLYKAPAVAPSATRMFEDTKRRTGLAGIFDRDSNRDAREYADQFSQQIGMGLDELNANAFAGPLTPQGGPDARLDLQALAPEPTPKDLTPFTKRVGSSVAGLLSSRLGIPYTFDINSNYVSTAEKRTFEDFILSATAGAQAEAGRLVREQGITQDEAMSQIFRNAQDPAYAAKLAQDVGYTGAIPTYESGQLTGRPGLSAPKLPDHVSSALRSATTAQDVAQATQDLPAEVQEQIDNAILDAGGDVKAGIQAVLGGTSGTATTTTTDPEEPALEDQVEDIIPNVQELLNNQGVNLSDYDSIREGLEAMVGDQMRTAYMEAGAMPTEADAVLDQLAREMLSKPKPSTDPQADPYGLGGA